MSPSTPNARSPRPAPEWREPESLPAGTRSVQPLARAATALRDRAPSTSRMTDLPEELRPRERLVRRGGDGLADAEILAVLLRTGRAGQSALEMASELLAEHGGLGGLLWTDARRLRRKGLGEAKAGALLAAFELARRLSRIEMPDRDLMARPGLVARYLLQRYARLDQEVVGALYLDLHQRLVGEQEIFRGTLSRAVVEPRAILRRALAASASGMILFHTHPSGDPSPSAADLDFTERMQRACTVLGLDLVDHLVVGGFGRWVSLRKEGQLRDRSPSTV